MFYLNETIIIKMSLQYSPKRNPRVIVIQKLYGKLYNKDEDLSFPKHRFKKFIKDIVNGTLERNDLITEHLETHLKEDLILSHLDKSKFDLSQKLHTLSQLLIFF